MSDGNLGFQIQADIVRNYAELFGDKSVNGRTVNVEELIENLVRQFSADFREVLDQRHQFLRQQGDAQERYAFLPEDQQVTDGDGSKLTVAEIRQGMLDNFFGNVSSHSWKLNAGVPIPEEVMRPGLQGTGPFDDLGMAMSALNARTASWMPDWEDAGNDYGDRLYSAWKNLKELLAGEWGDKIFHHPVKNKDYQIQNPQENWPTLFIRVPGLHLTSRHCKLKMHP